MTTICVVVTSLIRTGLSLPSRSRSRCGAARNLILRGSRHLDNPPAQDVVRARPVASRDWAIGDEPAVEAPHRMHIETMPSSWI